MGPVPFFQKVLDARAVARGAWAGAGGGPGAAPVLRAALAVVHRSARGAARGRRGAPVAGFARGTTHCGSGRGARTPCACAGTRLPGLEVRALPAPAATTLTEARREGARLGFAVSRHEDYRGLRLGWVSTSSRTRGPRRQGGALVADILDGFRRAGVARAQAFSLNARPRRRTCAVAGSRAAVAHAVLRARPCAIGRRARGRGAAGTWSSATATWTDDGPRGLPRSWSGSTPRPTTSGRRRAASEMRRAQRGAPARAAGPVRRVGVRPTYLVTWEMATRPESAAVLRELCAASGRCEIGTHLHPWTLAALPSRGHRRPHLPHNLPAELLDRQLARADRDDRARPRRAPTTYRAGRNGFDGRTLPILERLGYTVDTSVDPLFNERRKGGHGLRGRAARPYHPDYADVRAARAHRSILEIPITAATTPALPKAAGAAYARLPPIPWRGALKRLGLRPVWLRPSYTALPDMIAFATGSRRAGAPCFNIIFHSSEVLPGGSPYTPGRGERGPLPRRPAAPARAPDRRRSARVGPDLRRVRARAGPAAMNVLMVTPHLPPHQAANALLPHLLGQALRAARPRGRLPHLRATSRRADTAFVRRRLARGCAPPACPRPWRPPDLVEGPPPWSTRPTSCTSTPAPG